jgi:hypothetical protein
VNASQICLLASRTAKGGAGMVGLAGEMLNLVLEDLKLNRDLKINRVTQLLTVGPGSYGPYPLEADYLRTYDLFYPIPSSTAPPPSGLTQFLHPVTMEQWDQEFKDTSMANYPYEFATDMSTDAQVWSGGTPGNGALTSAGNLYIYPQSSGNIVLTHRYMRNQPDLVNPESSTDSPWFPFGMYLMEATAAALMGITGDDRRDSYLQSAEIKLRPYLIMEGDEQSAVHRIELDPQHFHFPKGLRPTKANPF